MQLLVIKTSLRDVNPEYALLGKKQDQDRFTPGDWKRVSSMTRGRKVLVVIPNEEVVLTTVTIPSKNKKQLLQAIPFALEDSVAEDIEDLHFVAHQTSDNTDTQVGIINRDLLAQYLIKLRSKGITTHFILPEVLTLKTEPKAWTISKRDNKSQIVNVRLSDFSGFSCNEGLLDLFISEQLEKSAPETIITNLSEELLPESLASFKKHSNDPALIDIKSVSSALPLNLLNNYIPNRKTSSINWKAWKPVGVFASLLAVSWLGIFTWQNNQLQKQSTQLNQQIESTFKSVFPKKRIVNGAAAQQLDIELKQLKKAIGKTVDSPLPLLSDIGPLLKEFKDLILNEVKYQENELSLVIQAPSLIRLETFKEDAANKANLKVDIKNSTTTSNNVEATLLIAPLGEPVTKESTRNTEVGS